MFGADKGKSGPLDGKGLTIGIVQARFNESITDALAAACMAELIALGVEEDRIDHVKVPGALEVPVVLQAMAEKTRVSLDYQVPIANAIITTENMEQALARQSEKGVDAARVVVEMCNLLDEI